MTSTPAPNPPLDTAEPAPGVLLYLPFLRLPENAAEMLDRLASVCDIGPADLRYKMVGRGIARMTPSLPRRQQDALADEMNDMGIPAAVVEERMIRRRMSLPLARRVTITDTEIVFFDRDDTPVFTVDKSVDLLAVVADLSGRAVEKPYFGPAMDRVSGARPFPEALLKISMNQPVAVFVRAGADPPAGVLVDHAAFSYRSLEDYMDMSAGVNFRTLVNETIGRAGSAVTDHRFGAETLAGVNPDWNGGKREILTAFGRYTLYVLAAVESGVLRPGGGTDADGSYTLKEVIETGAGDSGEDAERPAASALPEPPSPIDRSGVMAALGAAPSELFASLLFGMAPFFSFFTRMGDFRNPHFWQTVTGAALLAGGVLLIPYSLLVLHYRRMVENTPTSRVRSMAMGIVELEGRARRYYDLKTTHSKTDCIFYRCRYYRLHKTREGQQWRLMRQTHSGLLPFYIEDATGRVLVRPRGARFLVSKARQEFNGGESIWLSPALQDTQTRIYEDLIPEGAKIYILGAARPERVGANITERMVGRLRDLKSRPDRLMEYDANGDGRIDVTEWEAARADVEQQVYADALMDDGPGEQVVIRKPLYGLLPFIIADTEDGIIRRLGFRVWTFMIGGLIMIGFGAELLLQLSK